MKNKLFEFTIRAKNASGLQESLASGGAYLPCYAADVDYQSAIKKTVVRLPGMGFAFDDIHGKVRELDPSTWQEYVEKVWPEFADTLPLSSDLPAIIDQGEVFFGPIAAFEK